MGNKYVLLLVLLCSFKLYAQDSRFKVIGTVDTKYNDSLITLFTFTGDIVRTVDSTYVKNGRFGFEGWEYLYEKSLISLGNYPDTVLSAEVFLEGGNISVELKEMSSVHSPLMDDYKIFQDSCRVLWKQFSIEKDIVLKKKLYDQFFFYRYIFKKKHIHNVLGRSIFLDDVSYSDDPYFAQLYEMLSDRDRSREDVKVQYEYWEKRNRRLQLKDFTLVDSLGKEKKISDYIGKYKLLFLDFWASWCMPCLKEIPKMKEVYKKYNEKGLTIIGISLDRVKDSWSEAIRKYNLNVWPQILSSETNEKDEKENNLSYLYNCDAIPFYVLIDKEGKVVAKWEHIGDVQLKELDMLIK